MKILLLQKIALVLSTIITLTACKKSTDTSQQPAVNQFSPTTETITRNGFTLVFTNNDPDFAKWGSDVKKSYIDAFFTVYPQIVAYFNPNAPRTVTFKMDVSYDGIAGTDASSATVTFDPGNSMDYPKDLNVITHEVTHVAQQYIDRDVPAWLVEGVADYSKNKFGILGAYGTWYIPDYSPSQKYDDGYTTIARLLLWAEAKYKPGIAQTLDKEMRAGTYSNTTSWIELTGSDFFQLWDIYTKNPAY